jgi:hypothetical protein
MTEQKVKLVIKPKLSMEDINARIKQEICYETLEELSDAKLICEYKDCKSVKNNIIKLTQSGVNKIVVSLYDGPEQIEKYNKLFVSSGIDKNKYILRDRWYKEEDGWGLMVTNRAGTLKLENQNWFQQEQDTPQHQDM